MEETRLKVAKDAVKKAGDYLLEQFRKMHDVPWKQDKTVLLGEDIKSEELLISTISKHFPSDSFLTEETETTINNNDIWVFDPLCGSYSYFRGVETWSVSAAFLSEESYILGVVYQPQLGNFFYSLQGKGAFLNKNPICLSSVKTIENAFVSIEHGVFNSGKVELAALIKSVKRLRVGHGSGGELSYVAAGFLDAVIKTDQALMHFAGGRAILEEVGGTFIDFFGKRVPTYLDKNKKINYIATNKFLSSKLLQFIK